MLENRRPVSVNASADVHGSPSRYSHERCALCRPANKDATVGYKCALDINFTNPFRSFMSQEGIVKMRFIVLINVVCGGVT